jgi:Zn-dependent protease with chaperone function
MLEGSNDADPLGIQDLAVHIGYWLLSPLRWLLLGFGGLLTLALSRYREYAADRGAAQLTGAPEQL